MIYSPGGPLRYSPRDLVAHLKGDSPPGARACSPGAARPGAPAWEGTRMVNPLGTGGPIKADERLQRHFVDVWNPSYTSNAMEAHLAILLGATARFDLGQLENDEEIYVWWGKVRSPNRRQAIAKLDTILEIGAELERDEEREGHLYLTDYRALYVGHVVGMTRENVGVTDAAHTPDYYAKNHLECEYWYKSRPGCPPARGRRHARRHRRTAAAPESGLQRPPGITLRRNGGLAAHRHSPRRPAALRADGWTRSPTRHSGSSSTPRPAAWEPWSASSGRTSSATASGWRSEPAARTFIATAEKIFRDHRNDAAFDFGPVVGNLAKALEVSINAVLARVLPEVPERARLAAFDGHTVDVLGRMPLTLGQFARALAGEQALNAAITQRLLHGSWFTGELVAVADGVAHVRNPGVHQHRVGREAAMIVRNQLVGVGCQGAFSGLAGVRVK